MRIDRDTPGEASMKRSAARRIGVEREQEDRSGRVYT
jgi:hypothetical protein